MKQSKQTLRKEILVKRDSLSKDLVASKSNRIKKILFDLEEFVDSRKVHCYVSIDNEVQTHVLIKEISESKKVFIPYVDGDEIKQTRFLGFNKLKRGTFGILEPINPTQEDTNPDIVIVPGIVFDESGHRIGYGKGYYDKFLEENYDVLKIGLAFEFQILKGLPIDSHDVPVDIIITEKRIIKCKY
ncbi:MAG: 5-formyltetrahydrofolate cyclo-ligase [Nanoarchaeota archaeon]|nr:5-formyltetrahydrofolate cyclo-ligase [DPANN group archaeon]MBL7116672.1 5-formyltetrahydrofolate cyclo-ligase [Nanoarchaeota archaeon]